MSADLLHVRDSDAHFGTRGILGSFPLFSRLHRMTHQKQFQLLGVLKLDGIRIQSTTYVTVRAHFWLGRLTGFGAVTLPKETIRPLGLQKMACMVTAYVALSLCNKDALLRRSSIDVQRWSR